MRTRATGATVRILLETLAFLAMFVLADPARAEPLVAQFLDDVDPAELVPGATAFGTPGADGLVPAQDGGEPVGWAFLTSDFVPTTGYSGKPIHVLGGISPRAKLTVRN